MTQFPTLPGVVDGIISIDPPRLQCRGCGRIDEGKPGKMNLLIITSDIYFHGAGWPDGTNPRLCQTCRLARGCDCSRCDELRHPRYIERTTR